MNSKTIKTLEFNKIINILLEYCQSDIGKEFIINSKVEKDLDTINQLLNETEEAYSLIIRKSIPLISNIGNILEDLKLLEKGKYLFPKKILEVYKILNTSRYLFDFIDDEISINYRNLCEITKKLNINYQLEKDIRNAILSENEIADDASPELFRIRKQIIAKNDLIKDKLSSIISNSEKLMDKIYTLRDGRYVVPVKVEFKNSFKGIIHDLSSSGQTVYIEPISVVELNNTLKKLELDEEKEIERILIEFSNRILEFSNELSENISLISKFDSVIAKAKFSNVYECIKPVINKDGIINLKSVRHPLIDIKKVVPIDIYLGEKFNTLVITGPNTGGKTVTLKTVGIVTLMCQFGMLIPAKENSKVAIFDEIFADIGDEQSIEQSLSTFSSHMKNIVDIISNVKPNSLLLFDELGSGTDPEEGSGLSISILNHFLKKNIRTIATTHYSKLKMYAMSTENVQNGAVEFDVEKLEPTYKLVIGVSGKSNAFEISKKLGLDNSFIEDAKKYISSNDISFDNLIVNVDNTRKEYEKLLYQQEKITSENIKLKKEYEEKIKNFNDKKEKKLKKLEEYIREKTYEIDNFYNKSIKEINKAKSKLKTESINKVSEEVKKNIEKLNKNNVIKLSNTKIENLILGEEVKVLSLNENGYVQTLPDKNGNLQVKIGILKVNANITDIIRIENIIEKSKENEVKLSNTFVKANKEYSNRIDIRGYNAEDAIMEVDKFIDDSFIVNLGEIQIVHGKGTGVLRNSIKDFLRHHKLVKSFEFAKLNEGGDGVTVVKLK